MSDKDLVGMTPERRAEIDSENEIALASARASEEKRRERSASSRTRVPSRKPVSLEQVKKKINKKKQKKPTVKLDTTTGRIVSAKPDVLPTGVSGPVDSNTRLLGSKAGAVKPRRQRRQTRTGKKIDKVTGKIAVPTVRRGKGGKIESIPQDERVSPVTQLPTAGPEVMSPAAPEAPLISPRGGLKPNPKNLNKSGNVKGFAVHHKIVAAAAKAAMGHLRAMHQTHGTSAFHQHHEVFNLIHANIAKMDTDIHTSLAHGRHEVLHPHPETGKRLDAVEQAVNDRLSIGRQAQEARARRQDESRG